MSDTTGKNLKALINTDNFTAEDAQKIVDSIKGSSSQDTSKDTDTND